MSRLPFLAVTAARPNLPPVLVSRGFSTQPQASVGSPAALPVRGVSVQPQTSAGTAPVTGVSTQPQTSAGRVVSTISFGVSTQPQASSGVPAASVYPNGFLNQYEFRLSAWSGAAGTAANFLLPFVETRNEFRSVANGGLVESSVGRDIRFEVATSSGAVKLGHKLVFYGPTTGLIVALVNIPRDFRIAESFQMYTGKAGLGSSEEDVTLARAGGWLAWYSGNTGTDLTGQSRDLAPTSAPPSSTLGSWPAADVDGVADSFVGAGTATWLNGLANLSIVSFHEADSASLKHEIFNVATSTEGQLSFHFNDTADNRITAVAKFGTSVLQYQSANGTQSTDPQAIAVRWQAGSAVRMAINGVIDTPGSAPANPSGTTSISDNLEWGRGNRGDLAYWDGRLGFLGFCAAAMSNAALESMTAAFIDPRLVYGLGARNLITEANRSPVAMPIRATAATNSATLIDVASLGGFDSNGNTLTCTAASVVSGSATVTRSGGTITVTTTAAQSVVVSYTLSDGSKTATGRCYITVSAVDLFLNPFNAQSAHHRPIGSGAIWGPPPGTTNWAAASPTYETPLALTFTGSIAEDGKITSDESPLVKTYSQLPRSGNLGELSAFEGNQGIKYLYRRVSDDAESTSKTVYTAKDGNYTERFPNKDVTYGNTTIVYPNPNEGTGPKPNTAGDWNVLIYPSSAATGDQLSWYIDYDNIYSRSDGPGAGGPIPRAISDAHKTWPLDDVDFGKGGAGGSQLRWPFGFLRGFEISGFDENGNPAPIKINHPLQATVTRHADGGKCDPSAILMSYKVVWPAYNRDGLRGPDSNTGWAHYGTRFGIPPWLHPLRDSTSTNKVTINGVQYWLDLDKYGKALFDALAYYGLHIVDGSGSGAGNDRTKCRMSIRCDQGIAYNPYVTNLETLVDNALKKIAGLAPNTFCCLYPLKNPRPHNTETEKVTGKQLYYAGGGGVKDSANPERSINTAFNATAPGY